MLKRMLPFFRCPQLSPKDVMIPAKNRLAIKHYICDKPIRWGIKSFLLCKPRRATFSTQKSTPAGSRTATGPSSDQPAVLSRGELAGAHKNYMLFMDRFYNSVALIHLLKNKLGVLAAGTVMPNCKHYPEELGKSLVKRGQYEFRCLTSRGKPRSGVPHAPITSGSMSAAHAGVTFTLKFRFGVEPSPE